MKYRIAILSPFLYRFTRGIERFTAFLANDLDARGEQVDIFTWRWAEPLAWTDIGRQIFIRFVPYIRYFRSTVAVLWYAWWLSVHRYDWVIVFFASHGEMQALRLASLVRRFRVLVVFQYPVDQVPFQYKQFKKSGVGPRWHSLVAPSAFIAAGVSEYFANPCNVIYNGANTGWLTPSSSLRYSKRLELGIEQHVPVLLIVAAMEERKGIQWAIRSMPRLRAKSPEAVLLVFGEGPFRPALTDLVEELDLQGGVRFLGVTNDLKPCYAAADVGVLLSHGEGMPLVLIDYLSMGLPVITSKHKPFDEIVGPEFGLMVDEQDEHAVAEAFFSLLSDPGRRRHMGECARAEAVGRYDLKVVGRHYYELLHRREVAGNER